MLFSHAKIDLKIDLKINIYIYTYVPGSGSSPCHGHGHNPSTHPPPVESLGLRFKCVVFCLRVVVLMPYSLQGGMFKQILDGRKFTSLITSYTRCVTSCINRTIHCKWLLPSNIGISDPKPTLGKTNHTTSQTRMHLIICVQYHGNVHY